jgi:epoxyqueuosine reductase QueG
MMHEPIRNIIREFVKEYQTRDCCHSMYGEPIVGFADAEHPYILSLPKLISPAHQLPKDVLPDARSIVVYYVPFTKELAKSNRAAGVLASPEWARTYEETNAMFGELNQTIIDFVAKNGGKAAVSPQAGTFDQVKLISNWSQRHIAYAAGLGTFGINNMLITEKGCCGRCSTVVTNLELPVGQPMKEELCLYKKNGRCGACVRHCPGGALTTEGYDRDKCYVICGKNAEVYTEFGSSYTTEDGTAANSIGSEVCGKCITGSPCAFW